MLFKHSEREFGQSTTRPARWHCRHCDRIIYMEAGQISDTGDFDTLYARCTPFRELVDLGNLKVD